MFVGAYCNTPLRRALNILEIFRTKPDTVVQRTTLPNTFPAKGPAMKKLLIILAVIAIAATIGGCKKDGETAMDSPETHVATGHNYLQQRRFDEAIDAFERAIDLDSRYAPAYSGIGFVYLQKSFDATGETRLDLLDEAMTKFNRSMGLDVNDVYGKIGKALVMIEQGDSRNARLLFEAAAHEDMDDPIALMWWGVGAGQVGKFQQADYAFEKALNLEPTNPEIQDAKDRLDLAQRLMTGVTDEDYKAIAFGYRISRADAAALFARELDLSRLERRSLSGFGGSSFVGPGESGTSAGTFYATDIADHWAINEINLMIETGIMDNYPDGSFLPDAKLNRSEFSVLAAKVLSLTTGDAELMIRGMGGESSFRDVRADNFAYGSIIACTTRGILKADADGMFRPLDYVSGTDAVNAVRTVETILASY